MKRIILASNNQGKLAELNQLFQPFQIECVNQAQLGIESAEETGLSFVENAILKARHASQHSGLPAIADDSGLEVTALNGQPGIYSARYSGEDATDQDNNLKLLEALNGIPMAERQANFRCVMVYLSHSSCASPLIAEAKLDGLIAKQLSGEQGFGYDPLFFVPEMSKTCAQLSRLEKNQISHRGKAVKQLLDLLIANAVIKA